MPKTTAPARIRFKAKLLSPAEPKDATWTFFVLPATASDKLRTRSRVSVEGTLGGQPFQPRSSPMAKAATG